MCRSVYIQTYRHLATGSLLVGGPGSHHVVDLHLETHCKHDKDSESNSCAFSKVFLLDISKYFEPCFSGEPEKTCTDEASQESGRLYAEEIAGRSPWSATLLGDRSG